MFAQIQILARKFLSRTFSRFSDFMDQILAHDFGLNSFSAKIYFGRYIASGLYLFSGFLSKYTNEKSIWSIRIQMHDFKQMEGRLKRYRRGYSLLQRYRAISIRDARLAAQLTFDITNLIEFIADLEDCNNTSRHLKSTYRYTFDCYIFCSNDIVTLSVMT